MTVVGSRHRRHPRRRSELRRCASQSRAYSRQDARRRPTHNERSVIRSSPGWPRSINQAQAGHCIIRRPSPNQRRAVVASRAAARRRRPDRLRRRCSVRRTAESRSCRSGTRPSWGRTRADEDVRGPNMGSCRHLVVSCSGPSQGTRWCSRCPWTGLLGADFDPLISDLRRLVKELSKVSVWI
jgi:hypothetical protein